MSDLLYPVYWCAGAVHGCGRCQAPPSYSTSPRTAYSSLAFIGHQRSGVLALEFGSSRNPPFDSVTMPSFTPVASLHMYVFVYPCAWDLLVVDGVPLQWDRQLVIWVSRLLPAMNRANAYLLYTSRTRSIPRIIYTSSDT